MVSNYNTKVVYFEKLNNKFWKIFSENRNINFH